MDAVSWTIMIASGVVAALIVFSSRHGLRIGSTAIFRGSGRPVEMAQTLLSSIHITSQMLFGLLAVALVCLLMAEKIVSTEAGLPLLSAVVGYLLGKGFKDVSSARSEAPPESGQ
ncbi:MAG: hypothetical protein GY715_00015 [Planctomycetes bacterium]|nr:hypothetical protein [Planctomycetota bacterium]